MTRKELITRVAMLVSGVLTMVAVCLIPHDPSDMDIWAILASSVLIVGSLSK